MAFYTNCFGRAAVAIMDYAYKLGLRSRRLVASRTKYKRILRKTMNALKAKHQALEVARFLMVSMDTPQPHFGALRDKPLSVLINNDFEPIDLKSPGVAALAKYLGLTTLDPGMKLDGLKSLIQGVRNFSDQRLQELSPVVDWILDGNRDGTCALSDLLSFITATALPSKLDLDVVPIFDPDCEVSGKARFSLEVEVFQDCGDYDEQTGEAFYHVLQAGSTYHSDSLEKILAVVGDLVEHSIEMLCREQFEDQMFVKRACVYEGDDAIISIDFEMMGDCYAAVNRQGLAGYKMRTEDIWIRNPEPYMLSSIRNVFGYGAYQCALERKCGVDFGL